MHIQKIQNNNYSTNFLAKFDIEPVKDMITGEEILKLQQKAKKIGSNKSAIRVIVKHPYSRIEGDYREGTVYHGYQMPAITYHEGKLDLKELGPEIQMESLFKRGNEIKDEYKFLYNKSMVR